MGNRISFMEFNNMFSKQPIISVDDIRRSFPGLNKRRLHEWVSRGLLNNIQKGIYTGNGVHVSQEFLFYAANRIRVPSYISLNSAMSFYGLIPEYVPNITSVTSKKSTVLKVSSNIARYFSVKEELMFGYTLLPYVDNLNIRIAYPEKAILDLLYLNSNLDEEGKILELRINAENFKQIINKTRFDEYILKFNSKALLKRVKILERIIYA